MCSSDLFAFDERGSEDVSPTERRRRSAGSTVNESKTALGCRVVPVIRTHRLEPVNSALEENRGGLDHADINGALFDDERASARIHWPWVGAGKAGVKGHHREKCRDGYNEFHIVRFK